MVRIVAAAQQRLQGNWVLSIGCRGAFGFGFGFIGRRLDVIAVYACNRGPRLSSIRANYLLFLIFVCRRFARKRLASSSGDSFRVFLIVRYRLLENSGKNRRGSSPGWEALGSDRSLSNPYACACLV